MKNQSTGTKCTKLELFLYSLHHSDSKQCLNVMVTFSQTKFEVYERK